MERPPQEGDLPEKHSGGLTKTTTLKILKRWSRRFCLLPGKVVDWGACSTCRQGKLPPLLPERLSFGVDTSGYQDIPKRH
ncbi:hypothetical protein MC885_018734 [Smutsia gigantea]|nr:hypothetical protein MC885_018734 [Smutsia gigantea]